MKRILTILLITSFSFTSKATIHEILIWDGYMQFLPNTLTIQLGDTIQWLPLDYPSMTHTITSTNIPSGAASFDEIYQAPADTFFQYIPQVAGTYEYECTPHVMMNMTGSFEVTGSPSSIEESTKSPLLAYPTPSSGHIFINDHFLGYNYEIFNINNQLIRSGVTKNLLNTSEIKSGIYTLIIYADKRKHQKLIIQ